MLAAAARKRLLLVVSGGIGPAFAFAIAGTAKLRLRLEVLSRYFKNDGSDPGSRRRYFFGSIFDVKYASTTATRNLSGTSPLKPSTLTSIDL